MTRPLRVVTGDILPELRAALAGGPAILPRESVGEGDGENSGESPGGALPDTVPQRVALVVETSGSTGTPKRVALSADALLASAAGSDSLIGGPGQWLLALPTHYIAGINVLVRSLAAETEPVRLRGEHFTADAFIEATSRMQPKIRHYCSLVPAQLSRLVDAPEAHAALASFDAVLVGGQSTPPSLYAAAQALGARVIRTYGSSETSGGCVYDGVPFANVEVHIVDGEVWLAGPVLADGYLDDPERTAERFDGRWYRTGDTGEFTDGVLRVTGRLDDVIISGGVKVSLGLIERVVRDLPGLADAVVVRAAHPEWGEVPVLVSERAVDLAAVRAAVDASLGPAGRPDRVIILERMPRLASGKPDRRALEVLARG